MKQRPALIILCLLLSLGARGEAPPAINASTPGLAPAEFSDAALGFFLKLPENWIAQDQLPEDVKKRQEITATKLSTAQAVQTKPLGIFLRQPFTKERQLTSLRIDLIDDPSVAGLDPASLMTAALFSIKKGDPEFHLLDAPRTLEVNGQRGGTFAVEHTSVYAKNLDKSSLSRARLWFFPMGGRWLKINFITAKEDWAGFEKEVDQMEKSLRFEISALPAPKKDADEILDGLKNFSPRP